jgi:hypothetical protein
MEGREPWERLYSDCLNASVLGLLYGVVKVRSEVGLGLLHWCNSGEVMQIGAVVFCIGSSVRNPASFIGFTEQ